MRRRSARSSGSTSRSSSATPPASSCAGRRTWALEWGSLDLESDHLLYAALQDGVVQHVLRQLDADPSAIAAQIEEQAEQCAVFVARREGRAGRRV